MNLKKLFVDVFAPVPGERVAVMVDLPHGDIVDHWDWRERREMAGEWRRAFQDLELEVMPLITFPATGANNGDLPKKVMRGDAAVPLETVMNEADIIVAMTEFSATAPLSMFVKARPGKLRVASMPGVLRRMEQTALAADYAEVARRVDLLRERLERAEGANVIFTTGDELFFDLRFRRAHGDDGRCTRDKAFALINLPSGEAFIVPYEGERAGAPSLTHGVIPMAVEGGVARLSVERNRIVAVRGDFTGAEDLRRLFDADPARRNIAELGLGCNDRAVVSGCVLEDEKAGMHWAFGRSEHLGGTVSPDDFTSPETVMHQDVVYARDCPIGVRQLNLLYDDDEVETIMRDGAYLCW